MQIRPTKGLTFDDVLLIPRRSSIASRQDVDTSTRLTADINIKIPILSANMDTVTEARMAIAMARAGGIGILHRFMSIEAQVREVKIVKRAQGFIIEHPYDTDPEASIAQARALMDRFKVGALIVMEAGKLVGLVSQRDLMLAPASIGSVRAAMTPRERLITVKPDVTVEQARELLYKHRIEKLPVLDDDDKLVGLITSRDLIKLDQSPDVTTDEKGRLRVGAAIGVAAREEERAAELLKAGADVLVLDIAHGHADHCIQMVKSLRAKFPRVQIIAGNVASREGARELAEAGADAVKVGIGPGSICTTRIVTGFGVPQLTAVMDSAAGVKDSGRDIPLISDGGIRTPGDLVKALAAGAETAMIGGLFAGCDEAPGSPVLRDGKKVKVVRGMASLGATMDRRLAERGEDESAEDQEDWSKVVPEGVEAVVPYRGNVSEILHQLVGGLRSGLSYGGAHNIRELQANAEFVEITPAGIRESNSHDVDRD
ncbi:MAG: IMP dehydrogenase [Anaerolineae bacterium CFX3]|nr:IMP dehydrogenase [Anaerolineae bacterium]MCE7905864.1 IMP dehydrogenase [Anaerolineae bacterium CFX3]MCQ3947026.1 IMP dehydrogenase [Anaerolineae bacterium]